jgi:hypothetical protein
MRLSAFPHADILTVKAMRSVGSPAISIPTFRHAQAGMAERAAEDCFSGQNK